MAYIADPYGHDRPTTTTTQDQEETLGAQTSSNGYQLKTKPTPKPEPWRPANAGRVALRPDRRLLADLRLECLKQGITLTHWFELQAIAFLKSTANATPDLGAQAPQIDRLTIRKQENSSSIAQLFQFWTKAYNDTAPHHRHPWSPTWTDRDATEAARFADADLTAVEIAILYVVLRGTAGNRRIKAFRYYSEEIEAQLPIWQDHDPALVTIRLLTLRRTAATKFRVPLPELTPEQKRIAKELDLSLA
jgi:hypothetical protein